MVEVEPYVQLAVEPHLLNYKQPTWRCASCSKESVTPDQLESTRLIRENFLKVNPR
jgi:hypothetical protein